MKRLIPLLFGLFGAFVYAQTGAAPISGMAVSQFGQPIPFAKIRVCNVTSTGIPCTPTVSIFLDYQRAIPSPNPLSADQYGNYIAYVGQGTPTNLYTVQVSADQGLTWSYVQNGPSLGTVTSVGLTMPGMFIVTGTPITGSGTFGVTLQQEAQNSFLAGPAAGGFGTPIFRPIAIADLPVATNSTLGIVRGDGTTITNSGGVLTAPPSGVSSINGVAGAFTFSGTGVSCSSTACTFSGGGSGGSGVSSINGVAGAFTFSGSGVSCTLTTCTFSGGSAGGVNPGTVSHFAVFNTTTSVAGTSAISALTDSTASQPAFGILGYTGLGGAAFTSTGGGGNYSFTTDNGAAAFTNAVSQFTVSTLLKNASTASLKPGHISLTAIDNGGTSNAANIDIVATEGATPNAVNNSGNVNIQATTGGIATQSGNVTLLAGVPMGPPTSPLSLDSINLITGAGTQPGTGKNNINIISKSTGGSPPSASLNAINLSAGGGDGSSPILMSASNILLDVNGNLNVGGTLGATSLSSTPGCLFSDSSGTIQSTGAVCGSGGGGGGIGGSGTGGFFALFSGSGASTNIGNGHIDDGLTTAGRITSTEPLSIADSSGTGGALSAVFGTAPTPSSVIDTLWADSSGRWMMNPGNTGALILPGIATAGTSGNCVRLAANGIDLVDSGTTCGAGGSGTPTRTIDSGAGTGATATFLAGATDNSGWITIFTGTSPAPSAGVVTVNFGGTHATIPKCFVEPANTAARLLTGAAALLVSQSTASTTNFVVTVGSTPLAAGTTYVIFYGCM